jgi:hypothetical protein
MFSLGLSWIFKANIITMENMIFRNVNFCNRGINRSHEVTSDDGMLLSPFGNLSHTSILYYVMLYVILVFERYGIL